MRGLSKPKSMPEAAPILIQLKQCCENKWLSMAHVNEVTDDMQKRSRNMSILQTSRPQALLGNSRVVLQQVWMALHRNAQQQEAVAMIPRARRLSCPAASHS
jgi:hypothetical protein